MKPRRRINRAPRRIHSMELKGRHELQEATQATQSSQESIHGIERVSVGPVHSQPLDQPESIQWN
jgi:bisphosphoglycerate-independent phosphoglycerate mutase (AlkP superfamily)